MDAAAMAEAEAEIESTYEILGQAAPPARPTWLPKQFSSAEVCYMPFLDFLPSMESPSPASPDLEDWPPSPWKAGS